MMISSPTIKRQRKSHPSRARRGVLLLMILSLLVLFVLLGMTFILSASQFKRASKMRAKSDRYGDAPSQLTEIAIHQILRDTNSRRDPPFMVTACYATSMAGEGLRGHGSATATPAIRWSDGCAYRPLQFRHRQ